MPEVATALLVLWNDVDPAVDESYNDWHAREHVPQRLTVPGMVWALRYARAEDAPMPRYLTLYGLRDPQVLDSPEYRRLLEHPTPASREMRPALCNLTRWICTLDVQDGIERFGRLVVRTVGSDVPLRRPRQDSALIVATRIPDAAPLPWLVGGQARAIEGDRLEGLAHDDADAAALWPAAVLYERLPIG